MGWFQIGKEVHQGCILSPCFISVQSISYVSLYGLMDCSTPDFPIHYQLFKLAQAHVNRVNDTIQPSHPVCCPLLLLPSIFPSSGSFPMSLFFSSGGQSIGVSASASVLPVKVQDWFPLGLTGLISLQSKELSRVFSNTTVQKHPFFGAQLSLWFISRIHTWLLEKL